jgi:hypothetical protein
VITVDTEAHSVYTFHTLICLIQLSAGGQAFVVDALALHDHLELLKPALEDPNKLKLFHGGRGDIHWLQRLNIFVCNVLDTAELATVCPVLLCRQVTSSRVASLSGMHILGGSGLTHDCSCGCMHRVRSYFVEPAFAASSTLHIVCPNQPNVGMLQS